MVDGSADEGVQPVVWSGGGRERGGVGGVGGAVCRLCGVAEEVAAGRGAGETAGVLEETAGRNGAVGDADGPCASGGGKPSRGERGVCIEPGSDIADAGFQP